MIVIAKDIRESLNDCVYEIINKSEFIKEATSSLMTNKDVMLFIYQLPVIP